MKTKQSTNKQERALNALIESFKQQQFSYEYPGFFQATKANGYNFTVGLDEPGVKFNIQVTKPGGENVEIEDTQHKTIAQVVERLQRFCKETPKVWLYQSEFDDFGTLSFDPELFGLRDGSWHNDVCPSFSVVVKAKDGTVVNAETLWTDYEIPTQREMQGKRFMYCLYDPEGKHNEPLATLLETDDAEETKRFLAQRLTERLAKAFAEALRAEIGVKKFEQVRKSNLTYALNGEKEVCASHDYCDANMTMLGAYCTLLSEREEDVDLQGPAMDQMQAAWTLAKGLYLTAKGGR